MWLTYNIDKWVIQPAANKGTSTCYAYASGLDQSGPMTITGWKVYDGLVLNDSTLTLVWAYPSVSLSGATGQFAPQVNGVFHAIAEVIGGKLAYRKSDGTMLLCFNVDKWLVQPPNNKGSATCHAYAIGTDQISPLTVTGWKTSDGTLFHDCALNVAWTYLSISLAGGVGSSAPHVNGVFRSTFDIVGGRLAYRKDDGKMWVCWHCDKWLVQPAENKGTGTCYAYAFGTDQTTPLTVAGWKIYDGQTLKESNLTAVSIR